MAAFCSPFDLPAVIRVDIVVMVVLDTEMECFAGVVLAKSCALHCISPFLSSDRSLSLCFQLEVSVCCQSSNWLLLLLLSL